MQLPHQFCALDHLCIDLFFYVLWLDEELRDVLSAKKLVTDDVEEVPIGSIQQFIFDGDGYPAKIIDEGVFMVVAFCKGDAHPGCN